MKVEGLEKIRKIKAVISKASTSFARFCGEDPQSSRGPHTKLQPPGKISINSDNATSIFSPRASSVAQAANYICTKNLMAMLSDISLYNEVYDIIKSNSHLYRNISCMLGEGASLSNNTLFDNREVRALSGKGTF